MSAMSIIGLFFWGFALIFGNVEFYKKQTHNPFVRIVILLLAIPFVGVVLTVVGLVGLVFLAPILQLFGWEWFITTTF